MLSRGRNLKAYLTCKTCLVSKSVEENFQRSRNSKTGYEYRCKQCREDARTNRELAKWRRQVELFQRIHRGRERQAGGCLLLTGVSVQKEQRSGVQVIYTLVDPRTNEVHYVGRTGNPERRFQKHLYERYGGTNELKCEWIDELRSLGLRPLMVIVENVETPNGKVIERERRWIFNLIQQRAPLTNTEAKYYPRMVAAIQATTVNFLTEPLRSKVWLPIYRAECEDSYMLLKLKTVSSYRWGKRTAKEMLDFIANEVTQGSLNSPRP